MIAYLLKVLICSGLLFANYYFLLRNNKFHRYNRYYLLLSVVFSWLLPLIQIDFFIRTEHARLQQLLNKIVLSEGIVAQDFSVGKDSTNYWYLIIFVFSGVVSLTILSLCVLRMINVFRLRKKYPVTTIANIHIVYTELEDAPFSFFNNLFWRNDISMEEEAGRQILLHEMAHIKQLHSLDRVFMQIVRAIGWFNPFYYLIEKELIIVHEYIADEAAITNHDGKAFAQMLLRLQTKTFAYTPCHPIFYSSIKKRILMITKTKNPKFSYVRRLFVLPLLLGIVLLFAVKKAKSYTIEKIHFLENRLALALEEGDATSSVVTLNNAMKKNVFADTSSNGKDTSRESGLKQEDVIVYVDGKEVSLTVLNAMDKKDIVNLSVVKNKDSVLSPKGKIFITTKKSTDVATKEIVFEEMPQGSVVVKSQKKDVSSEALKDALILLNGKEISSKEMKDIPSKIIESINIVKGDEVEKIWGIRAKKGVIEITLKGNDTPKSTKE